jgi:HTH-type transcriptional regulator/antitoxin HigA
MVTSSGPRPVSPGEVLGAELEARRWTQRDLAEIMGRPHQAINEIVKGSKQITPDTAIELAQAFGTSSEFWLNLESNYRLAMAKIEQQDKQISRRSKLFTLAPIRELLRRGWIRAADNVEELEKEICAFLDISSLDEFPTVPAVNYRHSAEHQPLDASEIAWIKRVEFLIGDQDLPKFSLETLKRSIPDILNHSQSVEETAAVPKLLMKLGVHFAIVPHLPKTYLDGATWLSGKNPVIALTLRYDRIDSFWFTLMHELAHVCNRHSGLYLDDLDVETPKDSVEAVADSDACQWLVDQKLLAEFIRTSGRGSKVFSRAAIMHFARELKRHPGIVVGQLHHKKTLHYKHHRGLLSRVRPFLENWIDTPGTL